MPGLVNNTGDGKTGDGRAVSGESGADLADVICSGGGGGISCDAATGETVASKTWDGKTGSGKTGDSSTVSGKSCADFADVVCSSEGDCISGDGGSVGEVAVQVVGAVLRASTLAVCTTSMWNFSFFFAFLLLVVWGQ